MKELKEKILNSGKLNEKELEERIKEKVEKFSGMLNENAAVFLIAREIGINADKDIKKMNELNKGENVDLEAVIAEVYPEREFESKGKKGKVRNVLLKDESGSALMVLWNKETEEIKETDVGRKIELKNFFVEEFNGKIQLKKGFRGEMELKEGKGEKIERKRKKISELADGERNVVVEARILRVFPLKEFESKGKKGMLKRIELIDETGIINLVLWNEKAREELTEGQGIEVQEVNARKGLNGIELHSNSNTEINEIEEIEELKELCEKGFGEKELNKVVEGNRFIAEGKIKKLNKTKLLFNVCPECGKSLEEENNQFFCRVCGQVLKPKKRLVVSFDLEDESGKMKTMVYGKNAEKVIEQKKDEIIEKLNEVILDELITELNGKVKGKQINFLAKAKNNSFTGETELVLERLFN